MPRKDPGRDFVESLGRLFEELEGGGFDTVDDIQDVASQVTWLLVACTSMTSARARASCPVVFPDGRAPKSAIALPPSGLNLDCDTLDRLCDAETGGEYVGALCEAMQRRFLRSWNKARRLQAKDGRREPRASAANDAANRGSTANRDSAERATSRKAAMKKARPLRRWASANARPAVETPAR